MSAEWMPGMMLGTALSMDQTGTPAMLLDHQDGAEGSLVGEAASPPSSDLLNSIPESSDTIELSGAD